jgi:hypothetical protein
VGLQNELIDSAVGKLQIIFCTFLEENNFVHLFVSENLLDRGKQIP